MKALIKVLVAVSVISLLYGAKLLLNKTSNAYTFYINFLSCIQLFLLLWCIFSLLIDDVIIRSRGERKYSWAGSVIFLALISVAEIWCTFLLNHPSKIPASLYSSFKEYYDLFDCTDIQYDSRISEYDNKLFYQLRKNNAFKFSNREFADSFYVNSASLRGNEISLSGPEIICVGDSYTLGWGNGQHDNYPAIMQSRTGLKVLNVSMSSYGTARELIKLQSLDLSHVRYVFWQYCYNDQEENNAYIGNSFSLPPRPLQDFDSVVQLQNWTRKYFPGKNFFTISKLWLHEVIRHQKYADVLYTHDRRSEHEEKKARDLLNIISRTPLDFSKIKIVVFELGPYPIEDGFIKKVTEISTQQQYSERFNGNLLTVDASRLFRKSDYYTLDVHLKKSGNEKLVDALIHACPVH